MSVRIIPLLFSCSEDEESSVGSRQLTIVNDNPGTIINYSNSENFELTDIEVSYGETKTYDIISDYNGRTAVRVDYACSTQNVTIFMSTPSEFTNFYEKKTYTIILKSTGSSCDESILEEV